METWKREGYIVKEKEFDFDLHEFDVIKNNEVIATITPDSLRSMQEIIVDLNRGDCVDGWEDGKGNTIHIQKTKKTGGFINEKNKSKIYLEQFNWFLGLAEKYIKKETCENYNSLRCMAEVCTRSILGDDVSDYKKVIRLTAIWECVEHIYVNDLLKFWQSEITERTLEIIEELGTNGY